VREGEEQEEAGWGERGRKGVGGRKKKNKEQLRFSYRQS
jgi:hypothetical protein